MKFLLVTLLALSLFASCKRVEPRPVPEDGGTVTHTGEPSHFQVDDKAAEIEVNANSGGVKVNAKPASLQVVAKPGTPVLPVFHPAIHVAQHYAPPPVIYHHPALFYHSGYNFPFAHNWLYNGIRRHKFPKPETGEMKPKTHKSDIPHPQYSKKSGVSRKRQFIYSLPQSAQPSQLGTLGAFGGLKDSRGYGYGILPQYAPQSATLGSYGVWQNPQLGLLSSASQLIPQLRPEESGLSRSPLPPQSSPEDEEDTSGLMNGYQKLYSELNALATLYNALLRRGLYSSRQLGPGTALGFGAAAHLRGDESSLDAAPSGLGYAGYGGGAMSYGRVYAPSPSSQIFRSQISPMQYSGLLGTPFTRQQAVSPYLYVLPTLQRPSLVGRSKVPGASNKKTRNHSKDNTKDKQRAVQKRQAVIEPILEDEPDILPGASSSGYKRQLIFAPALQSMQQLQSLEAPLQLQQLQLRQLQQEQHQMQPGQQPATGLQQLAGYSPLESTELQYLTPSLVSPLENVGPGFIGRSSAGIPASLTSPVTSPLTTQSLVPSSIGEQLLSTSLLRPQTALNTLQTLARRQLLRDRSYFRNRLRLGYSSRLRSPEYRRRLHDFREDEDEDNLHPEVVGKERITQEGSYSAEDIPGPESETLLNTPVGFGPITVEAKTEEGEKAALAAGDDKRFAIERPSDNKHEKKHEIPKLKT